MRRSVETTDQSGQNLWRSEMTLCTKTGLMQCSMIGANRDRGEPRGSSPPTPPYIRVRIRRFGGLSEHLFPQEGRPPGFGSVYRRGRFGPCITAPSGFTLRSWRAGRALPVFCRMAPSRCAFLLPTSIRSGLRWIAPPIMPSADFSVAITGLATRSVRFPGHAGDLPR